MKITYNIDRFPLVKVLFNDEPDPNNKYYDDLSFPIKTRADICYENAWHGYEEDVQAGARSENPLKKRTYSIRTVKDLVPLGMSEKDKHIIFPSLSSD